MAARSSVSAGVRSLALAGERLLQRGLGAGAAWWGRRQAAGRTFAAEDFRGRGRCHCPPGLAHHFVHSEGLREACDFVVDFGTNVRAPGRPAVPVEELAAAAAGLPVGATVHVKADRLEAFAAAVLPAIAGPIVLVTGDSDAAVGRRHGALLEDARIAHWFAQNCDLPGRHPRLTRIPIGLDNPVYTKLEKRLGFAATMALGRTPFDLSCRRNDIGDQAELQRVRAVLPPPAARAARALCTFHQNQKIVRPDLAGLPARAAAAAALRDNPCCHFVPRRLPQRACWELHGGFAFEVSPPGNGLDCFRTWEALALGCIPIVMTSTLDPLYEDQGLPVAIVSDWREIGPENLARWRAELAPRLDGVAEKLALRYWTERIAAAAVAARRGGGPR